MSRGIDLSTVTRAERTVLAVGLALFLNALLPYWYRVATPRQTFLHNGGLFGWGLAAAAAGFAAATLVLVRHVRTPAAFNDRAVHVVLGLAAATALAVHGARSGDAVWIGFWVEALLAGGLVAAGVARIRERKRGWV